MNPIKTILVPTDFSDCSSAALTMAIDFAKSLGAKIRLVHVFQLPYYAGMEDGLSVAVMTPDFLESLRAPGLKQVQAQLAQCKQAGVDAQAEQVDGVPYAEIVALSEKVDLVVMGTHGRTGLPRMMLGSVAERVVRMAKCPVLTVPVPSAKK